jgi:hypothetical protein
MKVGGEEQLTDKMDYSQQIMLSYSNSIMSKWTQTTI